MLDAKAIRLDAREHIVKLRDTRLSIPTGNAWLDGQLHHAPTVHGLVIILSSTIAPEAKNDEHRELIVALGTAGFATLALDLLTRHEQERDPDAAYNIPQLANRTLAATEWVSHQPMLSKLPIGLVASGTASAAAVRAAWKAPDHFNAIVCLAGRPDLAGAQPLRVQTAPIRILVAESDPDKRIIETAAALISAEHDLRILSDTKHGSTSVALTLEWLASPSVVPGISGRVTPVVPND